MSNCSSSGRWALPSLVCWSIADNTDSSIDVLPFVQQVFFGINSTKDYNDLGSYGSPMTAAYPWATAIPKAA